ncbi:MAG: prevent-host-death family protein [uncultured bacterium]|nr:MAG: prevent-host-death family protein [uncultured bacterium]
MVDFNKTLPITLVKQDLLGLVTEVQQTQESIAITRQGQLAAVLLSVDEYEGLLETIEILSNKSVMAQIKKSLNEAKKGNKMYSHEDVWLK